MKLNHVMIFKHQRKKEKRDSSTLAGELHHGNQWDAQES